MKVCAAHPQDYLLTLYGIHPGIAIGKLARIAFDHKQPLQDTLIHLGKSVPEFSRHLLEDLGERGTDIEEPDE